MTVTLLTDCKLNRRLHRLVGVYTCQNATLLEITCRGSYVNQCQHASYSLLLPYMELLAFSWQVFNTVSSWDMYLSTYTFDVSIIIEINTGCSVPGKIES